MGNDHSSPSHSHHSRASSHSRGITTPRGNKDPEFSPPPPPYLPIPPESITDNYLHRPHSTSSSNLNVPTSLAVPHELRHQRSLSTSRLSTYGTASPAPDVGFRVSMGGSPATFGHVFITNPVGVSADSTRSVPHRRTTKEDLLELLKKYNTVIIVDDSSSMAGPRWAETREALAGLADVASQYDVDGIDVHFLNDPRVGRNMTTAQAVKALFNTIDPDGITPIGEKLEELLLAYLLQIEGAQDSDKAGESHDALKKIKPTNFIIITDGAPSDDPESVIVTAAKRLDARHFPLSQVGIQFVQIGDDAAATHFLSELDDSLSTSYNIRDIVDATPYSPERGKLSERDIAKILLGGINRRIDKKGAPA